MTLIQVAPPLDREDGSDGEPPCPYGVMVNELLETLARPVTLANRRYPTPARLTLRSPKVAMPAVAATVVVPDRDRKSVV